MCVPRLVASTALVLAITIASALPARAAVTVARAEVSGTRLRLEGTALPSRTITVDGVSMGTSSSSGSFRIERDPYTRPADCSIDVNDGSTTATTVRLTGCTVTSTPSDTTAPTAPTNLTAAVSGTTANLSWSASSDAVGVTGYRVTRNGTVLQGTVAGTTFADSGLAAGTYSYAVAALDAAGNVSQASNSVSVTVTSSAPPDTTRPTTPLNLTTTVVGSTVGLGWSLSEDDTGVTGYRVFRNDVFRATTIDTGFQDAGLAPGTYSYTVEAFDGAGNTSPRSASVSAVVAPPEGLTFVTPARLPDATVGQSYLAYIVCSDPPGPSSFRFRVVSGRLPDGTRFVENTLPNRPEARVIGTPTTVGTSSFTVRVSDGTGATATRTFTVSVVAP